MNNHAVRVNKWGHVRPQGTHMRRYMLVHKIQHTAVYTYVYVYMFCIYTYACTHANVYPNIIMYIPSYTSMCRSIDSALSNTHTYTVNKNEPLAGHAANVGHRNHTFNSLGP